MGFMDDIYSCFGQDFLLGAPSFRVLIIGERAGYFEGVNSIIKYSPEEVILSVKKGKLKVTGENLCVSKFCGGDVALCGKINSVVKE